MLLVSVAKNGGGVTAALPFGSWTEAFSEGAKSSQEAPLISVIFLIGAQIFCPQKGFP